MSERKCSFHHLSSSVLHVHLIPVKALHLFQDLQHSISVHHGTPISKKALDHPQSWVMNLAAIHRPLNAVSHLNQSTQRHNRLDGRQIQKRSDVGKEALYLTPLPPPPAPADRSRAHWPSSIHGSLRHPRAMGPEIEAASKLICLNRIARSDLKDFNSTVASLIKEAV